MKAEFYSLEWIKGERGHLVKGIKGGRRPNGAVRGGNGSFIVKGSPSQLILTVKTSNGHLVENNIYSDVLEASGRSRMSDSFESLLENICETVEFKVTTGSSIDISELLNQL